MKNTDLAAYNDVFSTNVKLLRAFRRPEYDIK